MNFFNLFKTDSKLTANSDLNADPNCIQNSEYEFPSHNDFNQSTVSVEDSENNVLPKKLDISKKSLTELSTKYNEKIINEIYDEIKNILKDCITNKNIRVIFGIVVSNFVTNDKYIIDKTNYLINYEEIYMPGNGYTVIVSNNSIKMELEAYIAGTELFKNMGRDDVTHVILSNKLRRNYNLKKKCDGLGYWLQYESLNVHNIELFDHYNGICKEIVNDQYINGINDSLFKVAETGNRIYSYEEKDAEFIYEYIKYNKTFNDLELRLSKNDDKCFIEFMW